MQKDRLIQTMIEISVAIEHTNSCRNKELDSGFDKLLAAFRPMHDQLEETKTYARSTSDLIQLLVNGLAQTAIGPGGLNYVDKCRTSLTDNAAIRTIAEDISRRLSFTD